MDDDGDQAGSPLYLFVYGTLMAEEIVESLLGHRIPYVAASVVGFRRCCIDGQLYPAMYPRISGGGWDDMVQGRLYTLANENQLVLLDDFEDTEYQREMVDCTTDNNETIRAYAYVWRDANDPRLLHDQNWDYDEWRRRWLSHFQPMVAAWAQWHRNGKVGEFTFGMPG